MHEYIYFYLLLASYFVEDILGLVKNVLSSKIHKSFCLYIYYCHVPQKDFSCWSSEGYIHFVIKLFNCFTYYIEI